MEIRYPEYGNCIANLACSVLKYYGIEPPNPTLNAADELLGKEYKNVVVILLDAMGVNIIEKHLSPNGFFRQNLKAEYSSVFPPTTVAATTSLESGLYPNQHGWLGWTGYFKELDRNVVYFLNIDNDNGEELTEEQSAAALFPYRNIRDSIEQAGVQTHYIAPFIEPCPNKYYKFCDEIKRVCALDGRKYIYAYWDEPDHSMHNHGIDCQKVHDRLVYIEGLTRSLCEQLTDTLVIITADHGHINVRNDVLSDYPDIMDCLVRMPSIEARALNLFIKKGMESSFETAFNAHFSESYILMKKSEVIESRLFGLGENHAKFNDLLGDYLAVAVDDYAITNVPSKLHLGNHAGLTKDEMTIPLIAIST